MVEPSPRVTVVIPCFNEARRIGGTLNNLGEYFAVQDYDAEFIIVDDGSGDETAEVATAACPEVEVISYASNRGKGYAVKRGMLAARGAYRICYDADSSTPIEELEKVWPKFEAGADVVIGSRALPESDIQVRQPWYRENMGRTYNLLLRALRLTRFPDTQCGFKVFSKRCADAIFPQLTRDGFGSDCELLYIAEKQGFLVEQVPVRWIDSPDTRVHALWDSLDMFREVVAIRLKALLGHYNPS